MASSKIHGLTGIGAIPYMSNCNVTISVDNIEVNNNAGRKVCTVISALSFDDLNLTTDLNLKGHQLSSSIWH